MDTSPDVQGMRKTSCKVQRKKEKARKTTTTTTATTTTTTATKQWEDNTKERTGPNFTEGNRTQTNMETTS